MSRSHPLLFGSVALGRIGSAVAVSFLLPDRQPATPTKPTAPPTEADGPDIFENITGRTGIDFTYRNGDEANLFTILESLGGGVAAFDFDGDGKIDLFFTGGGSLDGKEIRGRPGKLYRNLGDLKFQDVSQECGIAGLPLFYTHGVAVADYDCDGFPDLLITGWNRVMMLHNEANPAGGRRFVDVTARAGLTDTRWATAAAWGDLDGDGFPDLYICYYVDWSFANDPRCTGSGARRDVCPPQKFLPLQHRIYRNAGNGTFEDKTAHAKLRPDGKGLGVVIVDTNGDGKPDIYVANDGGDNFLYINRGGFAFEEVGLHAGVATDDNGLYNGSMGVDAADYDGSGRAALWVTNFQGEVHALYRNAGEGRFHHQSQAAGIGRIGRSFVGFGTSFTDFDRDGWEDIVIANGHVLRNPSGATYRQRPVFFHNEEHERRRQFRELPGKGGAYFRRSRSAAGRRWPTRQRRLARLIISHQNDPVVVLRNVAGKTLAGQPLASGAEREENRDLVGRRYARSRRPQADAFVKGRQLLSASDAHRLRSGTLIASAR